MAATPERKWRKRQQGKWQQPREKHRVQWHGLGCGAQRGTQPRGSKRTGLWIGTEWGNQVQLGPCEVLHPLPCTRLVAVTHQLSPLSQPGSPAPVSPSLPSSSSSSSSLLNYLLICFLLLCYLFSVTNEFTDSGCFMLLYCFFAQIVSVVDLVICIRHRLAPALLHSTLCVSWVGFAIHACFYIYILIS